MSEKFLTNEISGKDNPAENKNYVALRISRVNHSCSRNADHTYDDGARVQVLFATRSIEKGEEICISYGSACDINIERSEELSFPPNQVELEKEILRMKWGIVCPPDCACNNIAITSLIKKGTKLFMEAERMVSGAEQHAAAFKIINEVLTIHDQIKSSPLSKGTTHDSAFQMAIMSRKTIAQADKHIGFLCDLYSNICPYSVNRTARYLVLKNNPKFHHNFLVFD